MATAVTTASLLTKAQISRAVPGRTWRVTGTDPDAAQHAALPASDVRRPEGDDGAGPQLHGPAEKGKPQLAAVQTMEFSRDVDAANQGFDTTTGWFAGCTMPQTQLLSVRRVSRLGDEAQQYALRAWHKPAMTFVLGVARTGRVNTVALTRTTGTDRARPGRQPAAPGLRGRRRLPDLRRRPLLRAAEGDADRRSPGREAADDAQRARPASGGRRPAALGRHDPASGAQNVAATTCDDSNFHGHGWKHDATRSFLIPGAHLATASG